MMKCKICDKLNLKLNNQYVFLFKRQTFIYNYHIPSSQYQFDWLFIYLTQ